LVDAGFVWIEPHSKRIKVKLTVQKEVFTDTILQQVFVVEYVVQNQMCLSCHRTEAKDTWNAVVQVRQKVKHKRTFFHLEQMIIKHSQHNLTVGIKSLPDGIDFFFAQDRDARRFEEFLQAVVPIKSKTSEQLISHDIHTNAFNFKYTYSVEIVPICRDDVVCLPASVARYHGCINPIVICYSIGTNIHVLDPQTLQTEEISNFNFWKTPFRALASSEQRTEYTVLDIEPVRGPNGQPITHKKFMLAEATVARVRDMGVNDTYFVVRTHLGHVLHPGDNVYGVDLSTSNYNDDNAELLKADAIPPVILIKKSYADKRRTFQKRNWKLKFLNKEEEINTKHQEQAAEMDMEHYIQELEENADLRSTVNIYKEATAASQDPGDEDLRVNIEEMLDEFVEMGLDEDGGPDPDDAGADVAGDDTMEM
jgi:nonsense-mediated mRNA decay protein 3